MRRKTLPNATTGWFMDAGAGSGVAENTAPSSYLSNVS